MRSYSKHRNGCGSPATRRTALNQEPLSPTAMRRQTPLRDGAYASSPPTTPRWVRPSPPPQRAQAVPIPIVHRVPVLVRDALTFEAHPLHLHPVRPARVWAEDFDPESLYVWGEGLKRFINRTYTHQVILTACDIRKSMAFVPGGTWNIDTGIRPDDICRNVLAMRGGNETCIT